MSLCCIVYTDFLKLLNIGLVYSGNLRHFLSSIDLEVNIVIIIIMISVYFLFLGGLCL